MEIEVNGKPLFGAVQATWNLLEVSVGSALQQAHEAGMGVIIKEAVANGRLTPRNTNPAFADQMALLQSTADKKQTTVDALALAAVLAQPWSSVVLSGAASIEHVQANAKAVKVNYDEETAEKLKSLAEEPELYWKTRSNLDWN